MPVHPYDPPVDALLSYGSCEGNKPNQWPNYGQQLGFTSAHIPALIQMAQDAVLWAFFEGEDSRAEEFSTAGLDSERASWAPLHAIRTLGQLRAVEAVKPLAEVLEQRDYDWCWEEIPEAIGLMGAEALAPIEELLATQLNYNNKILLVVAIGDIAETDPSLRDPCVEVLTRQLSQYQNHHRSLNGALVAELYKLKAIESAAVMEEAYQAKKVDEMFVGSWAKVQVNLGLKQASDFTAEELSIHYTPIQQAMLDNIQAALKGGSAPSSKSSGSVLRPGFEAAEFKDIAPKAGASALRNKLGFDHKAKASPKKGKKKKK